MLQYFKSKIDSKDVDMILDNECKRMFKECTLKAKDLRKIHGFFCCKHVAFAKYHHTHRKIFFFKPPNSNRSVIPHSCPFRSGGIVDQESIYEC